MMGFSRREFIYRGSGLAAGAAFGLLPKEGLCARKDSRQYFILPERGEKLCLEDPPERIVERGLIRAGLFKSPVKEMNLLESNSLYGRARNRLGLPRLMEWVGAGMTHPEWHFGFIIVDAKAASLAVLYGFKRSTGDYFSHDHFGRPGRVSVTGSIWRDSTYIRKPGFSMEVVHCLDRGFHEVSIDIEPSAKDPAISAELVWTEDLSRVQPLVMMSPLGGGDFIFNHKTPMPIQGRMKIGDESIEFNPGRDIAILDEVRLHSSPGSGVSFKFANCGFAGFDQKGRIIGLNATTSEQKKDEYWSENCIWSGERMSLVGRVDIRTDPEDIMKPWHALDGKGMVDISFYPDGGKAVKGGPLGKYHQNCGRFQGTLKDDSGETYKISDFYGAAEIMDVL